MYKYSLENNIFNFINIKYLTLLNAKFPFLRAHVNMTLIFMFCLYLVWIYSFENFFLRSLKYISILQIFQNTPLAI
jgi:hypothetical protein